MIAWTRLTLILASLWSSALIAWLMPDKIKATDAFIQIVPSICATLAGFLLTAMVLMADKMTSDITSWRLLHLLKSENEARLSRYSVVFVLFVITSFLVTGLSALDRSSEWYRFIEKISFGLTILCFYASLTLPYILRSIISNKVEIEIKSRIPR